MIFWPIFRKDFIAIRLQCYYIKLHEVLFSENGLQYLYSKERNKPDRSKLEETEKTHAPKNTKNLRSLLGFPNCIKQFIPNYSTLKYTYTSLK